MVAVGTVKAIRQVFNSKLLGVVCGGTLTLVKSGGLRQRNACSFLQRRLVQLLFGISAG